MDQPPLTFREVALALQEFPLDYDERAEMLHSCNESFGGSDPWYWSVKALEVHLWFNDDIYRDYGVTLRVLAFGLRFEIHQALINGGFDGRTFLFGITSDNVNTIVSTPVQQDCIFWAVRFLRQASLRYQGLYGEYRRRSASSARLDNSLVPPLPSRRTTDSSLRRRSVSPRARLAQRGAEIRTTDLPIRQPQRVALSTQPLGTSSFEITQHDRVLVQDDNVPVHSGANPFALVKPLKSYIDFDALLRKYPPEAEECPPTAEKSPSEGEECASKKGEDPLKADEGPATANECAPKKEEYPLKKQENPSKDEEQPLKKEESPSMGDNSCRPEDDFDNALLTKYLAEEDDDSISEDDSDDDRLSEDCCDDGEDDKDSSEEDSDLYRQGKLPPNYEYLTDLTTCVIPGDLKNKIILRYESCVREAGSATNGPKFEEVKVRLWVMSRLPNGPAEIRQNNSRYEWLCARLIALKEHVLKDNWSSEIRLLKQLQVLKPTIYERQRLEWYLELVGGPCPELARPVAGSPEATIGAPVAVVEQPFGGGPEEASIKEVKDWHWQEVNESKNSRRVVQKLYEQLANAPRQNLYQVLDTIPAGVIKFRLHLLMVNISKGLPVGRDLDQQGLAVYLLLIKLYICWVERSNHSFSQVLNPGPTIVEMHTFPAMVQWLKLWMERRKAEVIVIDDD